MINLNSRLGSLSGLGAWSKPTCFLPPYAGAIAIPTRAYFRERTSARREQPPSHSARARSRPAPSLCSNSQSTYVFCSHFRSRVLFPTAFFPAVFFPTVFILLRDSDKTRKTLNTHPARRDQRPELHPGPRAGDAGGDCGRDFEGWVMSVIGMKVREC